MSKLIQYLKCLTNGRTFNYTEELAKRGDMVPCGSNGQLLTGHVAAEAEAAANGVRKSKFIGLMVDGEPGRLFNYTEQLSLKPGAVSIDHPDEWAGDTSNVVPEANVVNINPEPPVPVGEPAPILQAAALSRSASADAINQAEIDNQMAEANEVVPGLDGTDEATDLTGNQGDSGDDEIDPLPEAATVPPVEFVVVPDVSKIADKDEAKSALCKWAFENFEVQIRRNYGVERMIVECQKLIDTPTPEAAAG